MNPRLPNQVQKHLFRRRVQEVFLMYHFIQLKKKNLRSSFHSKGQFLHIRFVAFVKIRLIWPPFLLVLDCNGFINKKFSYPVEIEFVLIIWSKKKIFEDDLKMIQVHSNTSSLTANEICLFLRKLSDSVSSTFLDRIQSNELSDKQLFSFTSFNND